jgi:hypothetical protein
MVRDGAGEPVELGDHDGIVYGTLMHVTVQVGAGIQTFCWSIR